MVWLVVVKVSLTVSMVETPVCRDVLVCPADLDGLESAGEPSPACRIVTSAS